MRCSGVIPRICAAWPLLSDDSLQYLPTPRKIITKLFVTTISSFKYHHLLQTLLLSICTRMSTLPSSQRGATFHHFSHLPAELRTQIWTYIALEPRYLKLEPIGKVNEGHDFRICSPAPILHTCQESRTQGLGFYRKAFTVSNNPRHIWVNFEADTIEIMDIRLSRNKLEWDDLKRIKRLVLNVKDIDVFVNRYMMRWWFQPPLEDIILLSFHGISSWDAEDIHEVTNRFKHWFDWRNLKSPRMRIRERHSGIEMDLQNHEALLQGEVIGYFQRKRQGRCLGDYNLVENDAYASSTTTVERIFPHFMFQET
jgi:hypothetical protein